jgi:hypothetical protein
VVDSLFELHGFDTVCGARKPQLLSLKFTSELSLGGAFLKPSLGGAAPAFVCSQFHIIFPLQHYKSSLFDDTMTGV